MFRILRQCLRGGIVTEQTPVLVDTELEALGVQLRRVIDARFGHSLAIRQVDAGSCNGCELEIHALNNPYYDIERFGVHFVASPRHADALLVTGPVSRHMETALRRTWRATPIAEIRDRRWYLRLRRRRIRHQLCELWCGGKRDPGGCENPGLSAIAAGTA